MERTPAHRAGQPAIDDRLDRIGQHDVGLDAAHQPEQIEQRRPMSASGFMPERAMRSGKYSTPHDANRDSVSASRPFAAANTVNPFARMARINGPRKLISVDGTPPISKQDVMSCATRRPSFAWRSHRRTDSRMRLAGLRVGPGSSSALRSSSVRRAEYASRGPSPSASTGSPGSVESPGACRHSFGSNSGMPPHVEPRAGNPRLMASISARGRPSVTLG